ncbi:MAG TPA: hypothetical protein VII69_09675 [Candidatus Eremiobacteraceae bacterium]
MSHTLKVAAVGLVALAMTACSGNSSSMPTLQHSGTQSIGHTGGSMSQAGIDLSKVHIMRTRNSQGPTSDAPQTLQYFGGPVERTPAIYIVFWGFNVSGSDPSGEQAYMTALFNGLGGSTWLATDKQYYQTKAGVNQKIKNPTGQLKGTWVDSSSVPSSPTDAQIRAEAASAESHFGYNKNANYMVATPHNHNSSGFGTQYCAYHSPTASNGGEISYSNIPYMTDAGGNCGENSVNPGSSGILDGVSIVTGHEEAESQTDPEVGLATAWYNNNYGEIGDICAWQGLGNITISTGKFAMQPLWSNKTSTCTLHTP